MPPFIPFPGFPPQTAGRVTADREAADREPADREIDETSVLPRSVEPESAVEKSCVGEDRRFFCWLLTAFLLIFAIEWTLVVTRRPQPVRLERGDYFQAHFRVDINRAGWIDWIQLEGIGPALAHRIEADRRIKGPFQSIDDLQRVSGIGPATLERIRPWLVLKADPESAISGISVPAVMP